MIFFPSDFVWDTTAQQLVIVEPIPLSISDAIISGESMAVDFLAMDNPTLSTNWAWVMTAAIPGMPAPPPRLLTISYANGPEQLLTDLLAASTIVT
jgi:hypothetical protein